MWWVSILFFLSGISADSTFRFGAVLSTQGAYQQMREAKNGYQLYFDTVNSVAEGRGFLLQGKPNTAAFYFNYSFHWREDESDTEIHEKMLRELIDDEKVHFLGGSHPTYAAEEMRIANESGVLNYHCCVGPDVFYEHDYPVVFGIPVSNIDYTKVFIRTLSLGDIGSMAVIYEEGNTFTRTTCEAAIRFAEELGTIQQTEDVELVRTFNRSNNMSNRMFKQFALDAQENQVHVVVACVFPQDGKLLVDAFHDIEYPLRAFFVTTGPTNEDWVNSFDPPFRANDLLSAAQWHSGMKYADDFFGTTLEYSELHEDKFDGESPTYLSAGSSAVGLTLTSAIQDAFRFCDITETEGDVDALLYNATLIVCDDGMEMRGYDRVLHALAELDEETFFGRVKFNYYRRNVGLDPVTTQVFERTSRSGEKTRTIEAVLPLGYATELIHLPAENPYKETCLPGYFIGPDPFDPCVPCPQGEASDRENADHCDSCPVGEWNSRLAQSVCMPCPEGTTTEIRGAKKRTDCICKQDYFSPSGEMGVPCEPCPEGARCAGGANPPILREGYWANETFNSNVYSCDPQKVCLGGENITCEEGYTGRLCSECADGYFSVIQSCFKCCSTAVIVVLCFILLIGWYVINVIVSRSVSSLEMILGWAQLANIIGDINLNWPSAVNDMFGVANALDFDVDILEPSCVISWGFKENFITQLCLPFVMTLMGCSGYLGSAIAYVMVKHKWIRIEGQRKEILSYFVEVPENQEELKKKWDATIATFLASVDITYVTIAKYCFDVFSCESIAGVSVLSVDPGFVCEGSDHKSVVILAAFGIVFYVIGYLVYVSWKLLEFRNNRTFADPVNLRRNGFVYQKFELDYWYTPAIIIIRKLLFVLTLVYVNNPAFQVGTIAIIINASLMIHVYTAPYVDTYLDVLFSFLLLALMFEAFGGLMFYSENLPQANREILEWVVLVTLFVLIAVFLVIFVMEMLTKYHIRFLKAEHRKFAREKYGSNTPRFDRKTALQSPLKTAATLASFGSHQEDKSISFELLYTFRPGFVSESVRKRPEFISDWDRLTNMLKDYMCDQSDTSYLSMDPVAKFWRKLVDRFPELVDFLAVADDDTRSKFNKFATNLYRNFYLTNKVAPLPLMDILNWRDYAPMAQWLAIAPSEERKFFIDFVSEMFRTNGNMEAAEMLECKVEHGGADPQLEHRHSVGRSTKKKKRILDSLSSGTDPFHHSAAERQLSTAAAVAMGVSRFRAGIQKESSKSLQPPDEHEGKDAGQVEESKEIEEPAVYEKQAKGKLSPATLNNQTSFQSEGSSSYNKSVTFSADFAEESIDET